LSSSSGEEEDAGEEPAEESGGVADDPFVEAHGVRWEKNKGRTDCPTAADGYSRGAEFRLPHYEEKSELEFFLACFPILLVEEICDLMSEKGRAKREGYQFSVTKGEFWQLMGYLEYIMLHPCDQPTEDYWVGPDSDRDMFVKHNLGQYGMTIGRFWRLLGAFTLPQYLNDEGVPVDPFAPIRRFADQWNAAMAAAVSPGLILVVDESMGQWLGKGMPGLMYVARKPTPNGREGHTLACADCECILAYEIYEGKELMAKHKYVTELGSGAAIAMRMTFAWHRTKRIVLLDSAFASLKAAQALAGVGLFCIGNVKTAHKGYPKAWLQAQVNVREDRASAVTTFIVNGRTWEVLAAIDKDKQPMSLIGTAGTTRMGKELLRHFTVKRSNGEWDVRSASLKQWQIHELYRSCFNAVDVHNSKRQGGSCFEDTWKTHKWWVRDYQVLFGISEVNAYLLWRRFKPGQEKCSFTTFRMALCGQLLRNKWLETDGPVDTSGIDGDGVERHNLVRRDEKRACRVCGRRTRFRCECVEDEVDEHVEATKGGKRGKDSNAAAFCCLCTGRRCFLDHVEGKQIEKRRTVSLKARWSKLARRSRAKHMAAGPNAA
jgi:hypothetical protein